MSRHEVAFYPDVLKDIKRLDGSQRKIVLKRISNLTLLIFLPNQIQPTYVIAIPGRSRGALRAGQALSERLCKATGVKIKPGPPAKHHADRRDGSSYTTLSS